MFFTFTTRVAFTLRNLLKVSGSTNHNKRYLLKAKVDLLTSLISSVPKEGLILPKAVLLQKTLGKSFTREPQETVNRIRSSYYNKYILLLIYSKKNTLIRLLFSYSTNYQHILVMAEEFLMLLL
jgi:hypothetical protein